MQIVEKLAIRRKCQAKVRSRLRLDNAGIARSGGSPDPQALTTHFFARKSDLRSVGRNGRLGNLTAERQRAKLHGIEWRWSVRLYGRTIDRIAGDGQNNGQQQNLRRECV